MANPEILCPFCLVKFSSYYTTFQPQACEVCPDCETEFDLANSEEEQAEWDSMRLEEDAKRGAATHARIMVMGEDGVEFCFRNMLEKNDLLDLILDGVRARYPEASNVWTEDEESTSANYHRALIEELY